MKKRILSLILAIVMVAGMLPVSAFAAETDNLCDHHTEHTADCGYAAAVEGSDCTHECGEECAEICTHVHDEGCGYVAAVAGSECTFVCTESHGEEDEAVCTCGQRCVDTSGSSECVVCSEDISGCTGLVVVAPPCTCTVECSEDAPNASCYVCDRGGTCKGAGGGSIEAPLCTCTVKCFEDAPNASCTVCSEGGTCKGTGGGLITLPTCTCTEQCTDTVNTSCLRCRSYGNLCDGPDSDSGENTEAAVITGVTITVDDVPYTEGNVTITPDTQSIVFTVTGTSFANVSADNFVRYAPGLSGSLNSGHWTIDTEANTATQDFSAQISVFTSCDNYEVKYSNDRQSTWVSTGIYLTYDDGTGGEEDTPPAEITDISVTVDGVNYTEGNVTITPDTQSIVFTVTGTNFANTSADNVVIYAFGSSSALNDGDWTIDTEANTATADMVELKSKFAVCDNFEVKYSNDGESTWLSTRIYLTYVRPVPDSNGKIVVDMKDSYGDGWYGSAIEIYKNGSLESTATVDEIFNIVSLDYDSTASYAFKWVESSFSFQCSFIIYVDGEEKLEVSDASGLKNGETLLTLGDTTGDDTPGGDTTGDDTPGDDTTGDDTTGGEVNTILAIGANEIADGNIYTYTAEQDGTLYVTVRGLYYGEDGIITSDGLNSWVAVSINGTAITEFANTVEVSAGDAVTIEMTSLDGDTYHGTVEISWEAPVFAEITSVSITVDGVTYPSGNVAITPTSTVVINITGTNFAYVSDFNVVMYEPSVADQLINNHWLIDTAANTATCDFSEMISWFESCDSFEIEYSNDGQQSWTGTGIYLTYDDGTGGEEDTTPAEITGISITIDGVTYDSTNTSAENPAVFTPETQSMTVTVNGTGLNNGASDCWVSYTPVLSGDAVGSDRWTISGDGSFATNDAIWLRDILTVTSSAWEIRYGNTGDERLSSGVYLKFETAVAGKIVVDAASAIDTVSWNGAAIEVYKNGSLETTVTVAEQVSSVSMDYDPAASYEFKWVKAEGAAGDCAIHVDGETMLEVSDVAALADGETILTLRGTVEPVGLVITQQPADSSAKIGQRYCVEVIAEGEGLTYKWYFRNKGASRWNVSSVTDSTYDDVMTSARAGRDVYCVITDAFGNKVKSDTVTLIGLPEVELRLLAQPNDASAKLGEQFCVTVEAEGDGLTYRWYYRTAGTEQWLNSNVRDNTYDDVMTAARHNREVYCVITDAWGNSVTTDIATISGIPTTTLEITKQPENQTVPLGDPFCVTVEAVGDGLKYQWYFQNASAQRFSVSGQKDNTYDDVMTKARHMRSLYCVITDAWGNSVTTDPVVVIMATQKHELAITAQPENASVKMGEEFCVSVEAQGDALKYQWYWRNVGAETWNTSTERDKTYDAVMTRARHNREVYCVVTDMWGNRVETEIATITATPDQELALVNQPADAAAVMGETYCVTVEATGDGLRYQWYFKNKGSSVWHKSGVTDNTYDDVMTASRAGREVYCVITDIWGNKVTTETVTLICADDAQAVVKN